MLEPRRVLRARRPFRRRPPAPGALETVRAGQRRHQAPDRQVDPIAREEAKARKLPEPVDPGFLADDVNEFCELARSGAYLGGSRLVTPKQCSAWRTTFRRLLQEANTLLSQGDVEAGAEALEALLDIAVESSGFHYFRSEDPVAALNLVVSEQVEVLWRALLASAGLTGFARRATSQLVRWESPGGWTRYGEKLVHREVPLAQVLDGLLPAGDAWVTLGRAYVELLDTLAAEARSSTRDALTAKSGAIAAGLSAFRMAPGAREAARRQRGRRLGPEDHTTPGPHVNPAALRAAGPRPAGA